MLPGSAHSSIMRLCAWKALAGTDAAAMRACAAELAELPARRLKPGSLKGLLFGSPRRFVNDLAIMLRLRAAFVSLREAVERGAAGTGPLGEFVTAAAAWQHQHRYENTGWWPDLHETLGKLNAPEVNAVLDTRFDFGAPPKLLPGETPFQYVARKLAEEESNTPRLLRGLEAARKRLTADQRQAERVPH